MISARDAHGRIDAGIAELRREETRLAEQISALSEEAARIRQAEAGAYRALARNRLDALEAGTVTGQLDSAERAALAAIEGRRTRLSEIEAERAAIAERLEAAEAQRAEADRALEIAAEAVETLADRTEARLAEDPAWEAEADAVEAAEARVLAAEGKAERAEADRAQKSAAYDDDPLFTYLWARGYGTSAYRASNLVRYGDEKVARLVGFAEARVNYHRLTEIPKRLRAHADRLGAEAEAARTALEAKERAALEADGVAPLEATVAEREAALDAAEAEIDRLEDGRGALDTEVAELTGAEGAGLATALEGLVTTLRADSIARLEAEARATPGPEDDRIVAEIAGLAEDAERIERELAEAEDDRRRVASRRTALEQDRRRFRSRGYGAPGGQFENGEVIGEIVGGLVRGAITAGLGEALADGWRAPRRRGRPGFGGSIGRPRRSAPMPRPSRSSGGFRTGGGF